MLLIWAGLLVRSAVILLGAEILRRFPQRSGPAYRHRLILAAFGLLLLWPVFSSLIPQIHVPLWPALPLHDSVTVQQTILVLGEATRSRSVLSAPLLIWLAGVFIAFAPVVIGYLNVLRTARRACPLEDRQWTALLQELCSAHDITRKPKLLVSSAPVMPLTFGLFQPHILLPSDCLQWPVLRQRAVLLHELAHIQRRDIYAQLFASLTAALWWFQPLCWTSRRSLRRESERACDAVVLASGVRPSDYAAELLSIAQEFSPGKLWSSAAVTMARRGELESRLNAILDPQPFQKARKLAVPAICVLTILTVTASAVTVLPEQQLKTPIDTPGGSPMKRTIFSGLLASAGLSAATIGGSLFDPGGVAIPSAKASLLNPDTAVTVESTTSPDGKFVFDNLPAGQYILRVEKPGFASLFREFNVQSASNVERGFVLKPGSAQEQGNAQVANGERAAYGQPPDPKRLRIGGEIAQSNLITKVQPVYPPSAKAARTQGKVVLETVISTEGVPEEIRVVSSPSDDLTQSALEAVRQWRYKPTLLNGNPVEVTTEVLVSYTLAP